jgi:hypothetical protein
MKTKKVVLVKDDFYPWVFVQDADAPWVIDPKIDPVRNKIVEIPDLLFQDYTITVDLMNKVVERLMKYYAKG